MIGRLLYWLGEHKPVETTEIESTAIVWYHCARCGTPLEFLRRT